MSRELATYKSAKLIELLIESVPGTQKFVSPSIRFKTEIRNHFLMSIPAFLSQSDYLLLHHKNSIADRHIPQFVANKRRYSRVVKILERIFDDALRLSILTLSAVCRQPLSFYQFPTFCPESMRQAMAGNTRYLKHSDQTIHCNIGKVNNWKFDCWSKFDLLFDCRVDFLWQRIG